MSTEEAQTPDIAILGGGESGVGAALLARKQGYSVLVSDRGTIADHYKRELQNDAIPYEDGGHTEAPLLRAGLVIKSPGIPDRAPLVERMRGKGQPVISEIEFAARHTDAQIIGITGTNGKTTTAKLTFHLLREGGLDAGLAGNVGPSFARALATEPTRTWYVLELSSFQLDGIDRFRADIAMILNITPDHLDRYDYQLAKYVASKFRIIENQREEDLFLYYEENPNIAEYLRFHPLWMRRQPIRTDAITDGRMELDGAVFRLNTVHLQGRHNALNAMFAARTARELGLSAEAIQRGLDTFVNVPHRMEWIAEVEGVVYYNDSKATNVDSAFYALQAMKAPTVWIAGGQDKGNNYEPLMPLVREKVRVLICLGVENEKLKNAFAPLVERVAEAGSADEAVALARKMARNGEAVLLSPACASFDLFRNYEDRGDQFRRAVLRYREK